jgi:pantetheine-phosphate adenylyltransferase
MSKLIAVYAGSFDPLTNGHVWMIEEAAKLFDTLIVAIGVNPSKQPKYSLKERLNAIYDATTGIKTRTNEGIFVDSFTNRYLVDYAQAMNAPYVVRGIRSTDDFKSEQRMRNVNADMKPGMHSVFFIPPRELVEVSSSFVKDLIGPEGWELQVRKYVPDAVYKMIIQHSEDVTLKLKFEEVVNKP